MHPAIQPDVVLDDAISDWVLDRVDVGFRIGVHHPASGLVARRLFPLQLIVCAAPAYLKRHGVPATPADLSAHRCSVFRNPSTGQIEPWFLSRDGAVHEHHLPPAFSTNDLELELQVVLSGEVIGELTNFSAAPLIGWAVSSRCWCPTSARTMRSISITEAALRSQTSTRLHRPGRGAPARCACLCA